MKPRAFFTNRSLLGLTLLGVAYYASWIFIQNNTYYTNDLPGHLRYILHISNNWAYPFGYVGWESFQPPAYYYSAAVAYIFSERVLFIDPLTGVRLLSLLYYTVFVIFAIKTLEENAGAKRRFLLVGAIQIIFSPTSILMATRINNDIPLYALWSASFYFLARWRRTKELNDVRAAFTLMALGLAVKLTMVTMFLVAMSWLLFELWDNSDFPKFLIRKPFLVGIGAAFAGVLLAAMGPVYRFVRLGTTNTDVRPLSENDWDSWIHFFRFNIGSFVKRPFIPWPPPRPDLPFANYLLKSMLFEESGFAHRVGALILSWMMLLNVSVVLGMIVVLLRRKRRETIFWLLSLAIPIAVLALYAGTRHWRTCQDFRFIYPILVPYAILYTKGLEMYDALDQKFLSRFGMVLGVLLPLTAAGFYLAQISN